MIHPVLSRRLTAKHDALGGWLQQLFFISLLDPSALLRACRGGEKVAPRQKRTACPEGAGPRGAMHSGTLLATEFTRVETS